MTEEATEVPLTTRFNGAGQELTPVQLDHCYAKPWNSRQELAHCRPVRTLFNEQNASSFHSAVEQVDVESESPVKVSSILNIDQTEKNISESEQKLLSLSCVENSEECWEENVKRDGWTPLQHRIFNKVVKMLISFKLSKLASENWTNEAVQKKIHSEAAAKKLRIILSSVSWDMKVSQWLHLTLIENLSRDFLMCYVSILQILRAKVPTLVDRMLNTPLASGKLSTLSTQIMNYVVEKPWEPAITNTVSQSKLPSSPFIIMVPSGTTGPNISSKSCINGSRRFQTWQNLLQSLGRVVTISLPPSVTSTPTLPLPLFVESMIGATIQKIQELKSSNPCRPIILAGLQQGALIAAQVAYLEPVTALICLGFPLFSVDGKRGEPDDFILDIRAPTMIVIGQSSSTCTVDGIEQLRHRMKAESSLLVVDGATDSLRMLRFKKKQQNVTQSMVDASILEEMATFVTSALSQVQSLSDTGRRSLSHPADRKTDASTLAASAPASKRVRLSTDADEPAHAALSGHNYSQNAPFAQPNKGRGGTGLSRVRGGRAGPHHSRAQYQRSTSVDSPQPARSRTSSKSAQSSGSAVTPETGSRLQRAPGTSSGSRRSSPILDNELNPGSIQGSPKDDNPPSVPSTECKGGDSSETESAPPADDEEEMLEDLRFCNELLSKFQQNHPQDPPSAPSATSTESTDISLQFSGDEGSNLLPNSCHSSY